MKGHVKRRKFKINAFTIRTTKNLRINSEQDTENSSSEKKLKFIYFLRTRNELKELKEVERNSTLNSLLNKK